MRLSIAVDVLRMQSHNLGSGNTGELCRHAVATECNGSYRGRTAGTVTWPDVTGASKVKTAL